MISHDLGVVEHMSDRVAVMYLGRIVETGDWRAIFERPRHPYTRGLIAAIPDAFRRPPSGATRSRARSRARSIRRPDAISIRAARSRPTAASPRCRRWTRWRPDHRAACHFRERTD